MPISICVNPIHSALPVWSLALLLSKAGDNQSFVLPELLPDMEVPGDGTAVALSVQPKIWLPQSLGCPFIGDILCLTLARHYCQKRRWGTEWQLGAQAKDRVGQCCLSQHTFKFSKSLALTHGEQLRLGAGSTRVLSVSLVHQHLHLATRKLLCFSDLFHENIIFSA